MTTYTLKADVPESRWGTLMRAGMMLPMIQSYACRFFSKGAGYVTSDLGGTIRTPENLDPEQIDLFRQSVENEFGFPVKIEEGTPAEIALRERQRA